MRTVYIVVAVIVALIIAAFALMRWNQNRALEAAYATPTPAPTTSASATTKPIQLQDGVALGKAYFKTANANAGANTPQGGHGQPVDGITCAGMEYATLHVHTHLAIFYNGKQLQIPRLIGGTPTPQGGCLYWIHTHDASGIIHIESPQLAPDGQNGFTLANLFDIWGQPLTSTDVAGLKGPVIAYVNGVAYNGDLKAIPLGAHQQIVLEVGTPTVPPPNYIFPIND
ncbi:MAG TPA: hypothetical protein VGN11_12330 [Candidatus Baltobacteraceae bacterium]|nr:hypothetical protein [Candidatus Baltobacteraceae bacterium]